VEDIADFKEFTQRQFHESATKLLEKCVKQIPKNLREKLEQGIIIDIIFNESFSQLQKHIEQAVEVMISKIEGHKLEKYKERIGQFKPQLDQKIKLMLN
jgi:hypothetical protein